MMFRMIARLLLTALAFSAVLPMIPGIAFSGDFGQALMMAVLFALLFWVVDFIAKALTAVLAIGSFGLALLWLIPIWLLGFWLLPAVALRWVSDLMPSLIVDGWMPAILGGLIMLVISMMTSDSAMRAARR